MNIEVTVKREIICCECKYTDIHEIHVYPDSIDSQDLEKCISIVKQDIDCPNCGARM